MIEPTSENKTLWNLLLGGQQALGKADPDIVKDLLDRNWIGLGWRHQNQDDGKTMWFSYDAVQSALQGSPHR